MHLIHCTYVFFLDSRALCAKFCDNVHNMHGRTFKHLHILNFFLATSLVGKKEKEWELSPPVSATSLERGTDEVRHSSRSLIFLFLSNIDRIRGGCTFLKVGGHDYDWREAPKIFFWGPQFLLWPSHLGGQSKKWGANKKW
jgi:hypothetical protein